MLWSFRHRLSGVEADVEVPMSVAMEEAVPAPAAAPSLDHIRVLDVWRGLAVVLLFAGHFGEIPRINCGRLGVEFFFVLSGYLMGRILFVKRTPLDLFYKRRVSRILPAAYVYAAIAILLSLTILPQWRSGGVAWASSFLFFANYIPALGLNGDQPVALPTQHFWSLSVEEHAYIYLSVLAVVHRKTRASASLLLVASFALCQASAWYSGVVRGGDYYQVYWRSDCRAGSIICGAIAACAAASGVGSRSRYAGVRSDLLGLVLVLIGVGLNLNRTPDVVKYSLGTMTLASGLLLVSQHVRADALAFRPLIALGTVSYSLYLWQQMFYMLKNEGEMTTVTALAFAASAGLLSYVLVESPARRRLNAAWTPSSRIPSPCLAPS